MPPLRRFIVALISMGTGIIPLASESLRQKIDQLESNRRSVGDARELLVLYIYAGRYAPAADLARQTSTLVPQDWNLHFNEALCRMAARDPAVDRAWRDLDLSSAEVPPGPRWKDLEKLARTASSGGWGPEEDAAWMEQIRQMYHGHGWYTACLLIDIYQVWGNPQERLFLRKIRADVLLRAGWPDEALTLWKQLYRETGEEYCLYEQARCYRKMGDPVATWGLLTGIRSPDLKKFPFYFLLCETGKTLGFPSERMAPYFTAALAAAGNEAEKGRILTLQGK